MKKTRSPERAQQAPPHTPVLAGFDEQDAWDRLDVAPLQGADRSGADLIPRALPWATVWVALMVACFPAWGQYVGHPPLPDEKLYIHCGLRHAGAPVAVSEEVVISSPAHPADLDQTIQLPVPIPPVVLRRYLPRARLEQDVQAVDAASGRPAIRLSVDGKAQSHRLWLVADDIERNRLASMIATWRYMAVEDEKQRDKLFAQFEVEETRPPVLVISRSGTDDRFELPARPGEQLHVDGWAYEFKVIDYFPYFGIDNKTKSPVNRSAEPKNPAAQVEIVGQGGKERRWVFARFPEFKRDQTRETPFRLTLDAPVAGQRRLPDYALVTVGLERHEAWTRYEGASTSNPIKVGEKVAVRGRNYTFHIERFVPHGRLVESFLASNEKGGAPALLVETKDADGAALSVWLELGKKRVIPTRLGPLSAMITLGPAGPEGGHP